MKAIKQRAALLKAQGVDSQAALLKIADGNVDVIQEWSVAAGVEERLHKLIAVASHQQLHAPARGRYPPTASTER